MRQVYIGVNDNSVNDIVAVEISDGDERFFFTGNNQYNTPIIQAVWNEFITLDLAIFVFGSAEAAILNDDTQGILRFRTLPRQLASIIASNVDLQNVFHHLPVAHAPN